MIARVVVLPGTPLLVPGAAGEAHVLGRTREDVLGALRALVAGVPAAGRVVVLGAGPVPRRGPLRSSLAAAGIDDGLLGWGSGLARERSGCPESAGVPASVACLALVAAGWEGDVEVVELAAPDRDVAAGLAAAVAGGRAALVVADGAGGAGAAVPGVGAGPGLTPALQAVLDEVRRAASARRGDPTGDDGAAWRTRTLTSTDARVGATYTVVLDESSAATSSAASATARPGTLGTAPGA